MAVASTFVTGLRFELFFALWNLLRQPTPRLAAWRAEARAKLAPSFWQAEQALGGAPELWITLLDLPGGLDPVSDFQSLRATLAELPPTAFVERLLEGALHNKALAKRVAKGVVPLADALQQLPARKREWLAFIGLYPPLATAPIVQALTQAVRAPQTTRQAVIHVLELFWQQFFAESWGRLEPHFQSVCQRLTVELRGTSLAKHIERLDLPVTQRARPAALVALRGGYSLPLTDIKALYLIPSVFNEARFWTTLDAKGGGQLVYFPFMVKGSAWSQATVAPSLDPPLVFRALGDATRFAMATLLARAPLTASEVAQALGVSRATISHHLAVLRQAGLLEAHLAGRLSLRRTVVETLSTAATHQLFGSGGHTPLTRSRQQPKD